MDHHLIRFFLVCLYNAVILFVIYRIMKPRSHYEYESPLIIFITFLLMAIATLGIWLVYFFIKALHGV